MSGKANVVVVLCSYRWSPSGYFIRSRTKPPGLLSCKAHGSFGQSGRRVSGQQGRRAERWIGMQMPFLYWDRRTCRSLWWNRGWQRCCGNGSEWMHSWHSDQACGSCKDHCYCSLLSMLLCGQQTSVSGDQALYATVRILWQGGDRSASPALIPPDLLTVWLRGPSEVGPCQDVEISGFVNNGISCWASAGSNSFHMTLKW